MDTAEQDREPRPSGLPEPPPKSKAPRPKQRTARTTEPTTDTGDESEPEKTGEGKAPKKEPSRRPNLPKPKSPPEPDPEPMDEDEERTPDHYTDWEDIEQQGKDIEILDEVYSGEEDSQSSIPMEKKKSRRVHLKTKGELKEHRGTRKSHQEHHSRKSGQKIRETKKPGKLQITATSSSRKVSNDGPGTSGYKPKKKESGPSKAVEQKVPPLKIKTHPEEGKRSTFWDQKPTGDPQKGKTSKTRPEGASTSRGARKRKPSGERKRDPKRFKVTVSNDEEEPKKSEKEPSKKGAEKKTRKVVEKAEDTEGESDGLPGRAPRSARERTWAELESPTPADLQGDGEEGLPIAPTLPADRSDAIQFRFQDLPHQVEEQLSLKEPAPGLVPNTNDENIPHRLLQQPPKIPECETIFPRNNRSTHTDLMLECLHQYLFGRDATADNHDLVVEKDWIEWMARSGKLRTLFNERCGRYHPKGLQDRAEMLIRMLFESLLANTYRKPALLDALQDEEIRFLNEFDSLVGIPEDASFHEAIRSLPRREYQRNLAGNFHYLWSAHPDTGYGDYRSFFLAERKIGVQPGVASRVVPENSTSGQEGHGERLEESFARIALETNNAMAMRGHCDPMIRSHHEVCGTYHPNLLGGYAWMYAHVMSRIGRSTVSRERAAIMRRYLDVRHGNVREFQMWGIIQILDEENPEMGWLPERSDENVLSPGERVLAANYHSAACQHHMMALEVLSYNPDRAYMWAFHDKLPPVKERHLGNARMTRVMASVRDALARRPPRGLDGIRWYLAKLGGNLHNLLAGTDFRYTPTNAFRMWSIAATLGKTGYQDEKAPGGRRDLYFGGPRGGYVYNQKTPRSLTMDIGMILHRQWLVAEAARAKEVLPEGPQGRGDPSSSSDSSDEESTSSSEEETTKGEAPVRGSSDDEAALLASDLEEKEGDFPEFPEDQGILDSDEAGPSNTGHVTVTTTESDAPSGIPEKEKHHGSKKKMARRDSKSRAREEDQ